MEKHRNISILMVLIIVLANCKQETNKDNINKNNETVIEKKENESINEKLNTTNWKEYKNDIYAIKHPESALIEEDNFSGSTILYIDSEDDGFKETVEISIAESQEHNFKIEAMQYFGSNDNKIMEIKHQKYEAFQHTGTNSENATKTNVKILKKGQNIIIFSYTNNNDKYEKNLKIANEIFASLN